MSRCFQALLLAVSLSIVLLGQSQKTDHAIVETGVPLHVALDQRASYAKVGNEITGHITQPVYVGESIAIPAGTKVLGRVVATHAVSKQKRFDAIAGGDFTPLKVPEVEFYSLVDDAGNEIPIQSTAVNRDSKIVQLGSKKHQTLWSKLKGQAKDKIDEEKKTIRENVHRPHKMTRLKNAFLDRLPCHPQVFHEGAKFVADLTSPVAMEVSSVVLAAVKPAESLLPDDTVLHARLTSELSSATNRWGDPIEAVLTEPVFGNDHALLLPAGTRLFGLVTQVVAARRWARNGRLSFSFKEVELGTGEKVAVKGRLNAVEGQSGSDITLDEEGNSKASPQKASHLVPLAAVFVSQLGSDDDHDSGESNNVGNGQAAAGFGITGRLLALSSGSRYVAYGIGYYGATRSVYKGFIGRGKDVVFPKDTQLEITVSRR